MGRGYTEATTDRVQAAASGVWDITVGTWSFYVYRTGTPSADNRVLIGADDGNADSGWWHELDSDNTIEAIVVYNNQNIRRRSTSTPALNSWTHVAITWDGNTPSTSITFFFDGVSEAGSAISDGGVNHVAENVALAIGNNNSGGSVSPPVRLAEFAMWGVVLDGSEITALARGFSALYVRPASGLVYWPLLGRTSPEIERLGGLNGTVTGTTTVEHPRIIYPAAPTLVYKAAAGGAVVASSRRVGQLAMTGAGL